jgi:hypothetical protein
MTMIKSLLLAAGSASLLFLGACNGGGNQASTPASSAPASPAASSPAKSPTAMDAAKSSGGMVVESGGYHFELMPEKEGSVTHLDLFVQKSDSHESMPNAKVVAQVNIPDGSSQSIDMSYDTEGKHYVGKVPTVAPGEYKVTFQSDIGGEKVNSRFTFKQ